MCKWVCGIVADAAEEDFDLNVVCGRIASRDCGGGQRRCRAGSGIGLCFVHGLKIAAPKNLSFADRTNPLAEHANGRGCGAEDSPSPFREERGRSDKDSAAGRLLWVLLSCREEEAQTSRWRELVQ